MISLSIAFSYNSSAQVIGNWHFNNTTNGTGGIYNSVSPATFSAAVPSTSFNGGSEYYGHNGWPTGGFDPAYYLEITLTPHTGYALNIQTLVLRIRHSNTGSSGGSGPTRFSLRSSLDNYAANISTGNVTGAYATYTITPGAAFNNLPVPVSFRIYGHDAVLYSGGNNRLVFDNIEVNAIGIVLPEKLVLFAAHTLNEAVRINYTVSNNISGTTYTLERSGDAKAYHVVVSNRMDDTQAMTTGEFYDHSIPGNATTLYYRLRIQELNGNLSISPTISVSRLAASNKIITRTSSNGVVVSGIFPHHCSLIMYNASGLEIDRKILDGGPHFKSVTIGDKRRLAAGLYYIRVTPGTIAARRVFLN
jgi:hypothetical protein